MLGLFEMRYVNIGLAAVLIVELLILVLILNLYMNVKRREKKLIDGENGAGLYDKAMCRGTDEAHMLVRRSDMAPLFFTENFEQVTGIFGDRISEDLHAISMMMDRNSFKRFRKLYENWDRQSCLEFEAGSERGGEPCWIRIAVVAEETDDCDLFVFRDVTEDKMKLAALEEELAKAEDESRSKTTFLSRMSHEIRTPINGIIGMMTLSHKQVEPGSQIDTYLSKAENLSSHLVSLVNDILDMSRIEAGKIELDNKPFDVRNLAGKLRNMFQESIEAKGLEFDVRMEDFTDYTFVGDEFRLSQVLVNFLSNAVKFTSEGGIKVTFKQMLKEDGIVDLMIGVHDTGIGMAPEFMTRIFRPFEQENASIAKNYGGTGLGMAITDQIVRLMGGEIVIDSMPGRGSDFMVYLHLPIADDTDVDEVAAEKVQPEEMSDDYTFAGKTILMAEDNEINAEIACEILREAGAKVEVAANGQEAVDMVAGRPQGYYDFVLMDIQMPVMDGREAARHIRNMDRADAKDILIFALSADAFYEDERMSREAGMNGHFAKPVNFDEVRKRIGQVVRSNRGGY